MGSSVMVSSDGVSEAALVDSSEALSASAPQAAMPMDIVRARAARPDVRAMRFMRELPFVSGLRGCGRPREGFREWFGTGVAADWSDSEDQPKSVLGPGLP